MGAACTGQVNGGSVSRNNITQTKLFHTRSQSNDIQQQNVNVLNYPSSGVSASISPLNVSRMNESAHHNSKQTKVIVAGSGNLYNDGDTEQDHLIQQANPLKSAHTSAVDTSTSNYCFLSYCHKDGTIARLIVMILEKLFKLNIWGDWKITPGNDWRDDVMKAISNSRVVIFLLSKNSAASPFCCEEIFSAKSHQKPIFPIAVDSPNEISLGHGLKRAIQRIHWTKLQPDSLLEMELETVCIQLKRVMLDISRPNQSPSDNMRSINLVNKNDEQQTNPEENQLPSTQAKTRWHDTKDIRGDGKVFTNISYDFYCVFCYHHEHQDVEVSFLQCLFKLWKQRNSRIKFSPFYNVNTSDTTNKYDETNKFISNQNNKSGSINHLIGRKTSLAIEVDTLSSSGDESGDLSARRNSFVDRSHSSASVNGVMFSPSEPVRHTTSSNMTTVQNNDAISPSRIYHSADTQDASTWIATRQQTHVDEFQDPRHKRDNSIVILHNTFLKGSNESDNLSRGSTSVQTVVSKSGRQQRQYSTYQRYTSNNIDQSRFILFLVTPETIVSTVCWDELHYSYEERKPIYYITVANTEIPPNGAIKFILDYGIRLGDVDRVQSSCPESKAFEFYNKLDSSIKEAY